MSAPEDIMALMRKLEDGSSLASSDGDAARISIAISLRRIADIAEEKSKPTLEKAPEGPSPFERLLDIREREMKAMEAIAHALDGESEKGSVLHYLEAIARNGSVL